MNLMHGDCLEMMKLIPEGSVDMVLCDLPYGTTQNKWDAVIPFDQLWVEYKRVCRKGVPLVFTAAQPFASALVMSNPTWFKWEDIWHKSNPTGHLNAKVMPLRQHENILIFCEAKAPYNPQMIDKETPRKAQKTVNSKGAYGEATEGVFRTVPDEKGYPRSVTKFNTAYHDREAGLHPTQKPVALMEYLIRTYTNEGETVLDNTMGSGTTGVACANTGRKFIGIERDDKYFAIAQKRIEDAMFGDLV